MKHALGALMILLVATLAFGQTAKNPNTVPQYYVQTLASAKAYANSQIDTSAAYTLGGASRVSIYTAVLDSASYITKIDYRKSSADAWALIVSDTVAVTAGGAATYREWTLRDNTVEKVAGVSGQWRIRQAFAASDNGVTTATYTQKICWKP